MCVLSTHLTVFILHAFDEKKWLGWIKMYGRVLWEEVAGMEVLDTKRDEKYGYERMKRMNRKG